VRAISENVSKQTLIDRLRVCDSMQTHRGLQLFAELAEFKVSDSCAIRFERIQEGGRNAGNPALSRSAAFEMALARIPASASPPIMDREPARIAADFQHSN